ncbi:MAG TPA: hypothetical protein VMP01_01100 [Pirellulaceae bacterium]|nr:hypothetical protein [Pirellulaceae bacterium]
MRRKKQPFLTDIRLSAAHQFRQSAVDPFASFRSREADAGTAAAITISTQQPPDSPAWTQARIGG